MEVNLKTGISQKGRCNSQYSIGNQYSNIRRFKSHVMTCYKKSHAFFISFRVCSTLANIEECYTL